jgi:hypothetical protein
MNKRSAAARRERERQLRVLKSARIVEAIPLPRKSFPYEPGFEAWLKEQRESRKAKQ